MAVDKKALNIELLLWIGFTCSNGIWSYPDGVAVDNGVPFFPESLDACLKWLVPGIEDGLQQIILQPDEYAWYLGMTVNDELYENIGYRPALALCLAIRKLINAKE